MFVVGCDVGGTFTDFCAIDMDTGAEIVFKVPSTPDDPARAIVDGLDRMLASHGVSADQVARLEHGTTVATNTLIQRKGATVVLITTEGFADLLEIGRQIRPHNYDLQQDAPTPLVPAELRFELAERVLATGEPHKVPTAEDIDRIVARCLDAGADACAVCFLFSFLNPRHEEAVGEALARRRPDLPVSLSSEVLPEFREFERLTTTVLNAYLQPALGSYLSHLKQQMDARYPGVVIGINQSSGGLMSVERARNYPIRTALSGPAAGVAGAIQVAKTSGEPNVITLDMGGTSADVCLIREFAFDVGLDHNVSGFPIRLPVVGINTVGAGGGSIAWMEADGLLKVGPISAGSVPGPACYGSGGTEPTVTDANLLLGRLSEGGLLAGEMPLDRAASEAVFERLSRQIGMQSFDIAQGVLEIVVSNMVQAIRSISTERGHDPRECVLMAFGGAGPLHGVEVARALGIDRVLVPAAPGILCAKGLVVADLTEEFSRTVRVRPETDGMDAVWRYLGELVEAGSAWFATEEIPENERVARAVLEVRYIGQNYEVPIEVADYSKGPPEKHLSVDELRELFMREHDRRYGFFNAEDPVEVVNVRLRVRGRLKRIDAAPSAPQAEEGAGEPITHRDVQFKRGAWVKTPIYDRASLAAGTRIAGPAVLQQMDTTIVVYPGDKASVQGNGNLLIEIGAI